jgi:lipopolysaccharide export system ATP-binding protein
MRLLEFVNGLRAHDASIGMALAELVRRADADGALDRGEWIAAVHSAYARVLGDGRERADLQDRMSAQHDDLGHYLEEHVLSRLAAERLAAGEPGADAWERVRMAPDAWAEVRDDRAALVDALDLRVQTLLERPEPEPVAGDTPVTRTGPVPGGSTLRAEGLVKIYRRRRVVADVDLEVTQGEIVGLLGPNGAGKTTTFYMIVGLISPDRGRVYLDGEELTRVPMYKRARRGIGYLAQEPSIFRKLTVEQNIMAILETMGITRAERKARLETLLDELGLRHLRKAKAYSLSGGERRRLEITRALVSRPKFMLLDEPFAGVDPIAVHDIQQIVADLRHRGIGVVITDHNVEQTLEIVDRAYIMYDGRVRVAGTVRELVWNEDVAEIYFGPTLTARMRERYSPPEVAV